ncbi:hypothetical protein B0H10DRAFT_2088369 [Mycena sp. CBHHK59/15]|nr:hypothetical protein B0H10DRAFT_2088369 [Mycena sp. CBHHK59/15]
MTDSMSYSSGSYMSQNPYYSSPQLHHGHQVSPPPRQETATRKRPKYTRSKTGCLTCRVKKIKVSACPPRLPDGRPSTASSTASPGTPFAPQRAPIELNLPPLVSRRQPEPYHLPRVHHPSEVEPQRREYSTRNDRGRSSSGYSSHEDSHSMSLIPEISTYPTHSRYEPSYGGHASQHVPASRHTLPSSVRSTMGPSMQQQWSPPPILSPEPYYHHGPERVLVHSSDQIPRYH